MTEAAAGLGRALRVGAPFAFAFAISELLRVVNAVAAPALAADLALDAVGLGLVTGAYFLGFAVAQLPCGVLMDRYGARPVVAVLLVIATLGTVAFALAPGLAPAAAARFVMGIGMAVTLMAGLQAFAQWLPAAWLPLANAGLLASGQVGSLIGTTPAERLVAAVGWREPLLGLALAIAAAAAFVALAVPARPRRAGNLASELSGLSLVLGSAAFWRIAPVCTTTTAAVLATPALWAGGWLRDVAGLDAAAAGLHLGAIAVGMGAGYVALGWLAVRLGRAGVALRHLVVVTTLAFMAIQAAIIVDGMVAPLVLWTAFGFLGTCGAYGYAMLTRVFGTALAGRALTAANLGVVVGAFAVQYGPGWILAQWPAEAGRHSVIAYQVAFGAVLAVQVLSLVWFLRGRRD
ncbi:MAG: MFS transporter [Alphaproteobacteria bacterium]|nr:MFS transporter [Alphaproteobacteria bacterium]